MTATTELAARLKAAIRGEGEPGHPGEMISVNEAEALIDEVLAETTAVQQPNRDALIETIRSAMQDAWDDAREYEDAPTAIADAVLAALAVPPSSTILSLAERIGEHVASEYEEDPALDDMILQLRAALAVPATPTLGDFINIGPECFTDAEATVISYKGENYYRGAVPATPGQINQNALAKDLHERFAPPWTDHWDDLDESEQRGTEAWEMAGVVVEHLSAVPATGETEWEQVRRDRGWPTPTALHRAGDALDGIATARFGDVLRYVADRCDGLPVEGSEVTP